MYSSKFLHDTQRFYHFSRGIVFWRIYFERLVSNALFLQMQWYLKAKQYTFYCILQAVTGFKTDISSVFLLQYMQFVHCHLLLRWMFRNFILMKKCIMKKLTAAELWTAGILQFALFLYLYLIYLSNENCTRITSFLWHVQLASVPTTYSSYRRCTVVISTQPQKQFPNSRLLKHKFPYSRMKG